MGKEYDAVIVPHLFPAETLTEMKKKKQLNETIIKDIHAILTENIIVGGIYRNQEVRISGAGHVPPAGNDMYDQIKNFYVDMIFIGEIIKLLA